MSVPYYSEDQVRELISLEDVINSLEDVLRREVSGDARNVAKSVATWEPTSSAHTLGGLDLHSGMAAFKNWVNTPRGATAVLSLFDSDTGQLLAVMDAAHLGALRTAAVAGLATRWMAPSDARELAIVGSGRQALRQVQAIAAVRPLTRVHIWSRTEANRLAFADRVRADVAIDAVAASSLEEAVEAAPILTLVTRATIPFLHPSHLSGTGPLHINAMGAVLPHNAEFNPSILAGADLVAADSLDNAARGSRELREFFGSDLTGVRSLGEVLEQKYSRPAATGLTVFKAMGMGLSDLAAAIVVARKAGLERVPR